MEIERGSNARTSALNSKLRMKGGRWKKLLLNDGA